MKYILLLLALLAFCIFAAEAQVQITKGSLQEGYAYQQISAYVQDSTKVTQVFNGNNHYAVVFQVANGDTTTYNMVTVFYKKYNVMPPITVPATAYTSMSGITPQTDYIGSADNGDYVIYNASLYGHSKIYVDYSRQWTTPMQGTVEVREDGPTGKLLGTFQTPNTGSWTTYTTVSASLIASAKGVVCLVFKAEGCGNFKRFRFE